MIDRISGPLFKWFGSKWAASKHYPSPKHDTIVEPFAGSAGYSLRHAHRQVIISESNARLVELWKWLIRDATEASIRDVPIGLKEETDVRTLGLSHGQQLLLKNWQRTNNVSECWTISSWGNLPGQWTESTRSRVASEFHHVKHWRIVDPLEVWTANDGQDATWFVDPPYMYNYRYGCVPLDYDALARRIESLRGQTIACEAVCQKTGAIPTWLPFVDFRRTITSRRKSTNNHHSRELIYTRDR